ncbi:GNAT family N-acetyltransferase [Streptomyces sp. NPDC057743]|uniref:GNAT family N-acetyltransferase n=1 Tax=Streptomyces sp. NPDC057743 TaxID=3346236 RepID=UPI0036C478CA
MGRISVRPLEPGDWARYRAVRLAALADAPEAFGSTLEREQAFTAETWRQRLAGRDQFLAEDDGQACGLVGIVPTGPSTAQLVSMWVAPTARGRGIANRLVGEALRGADTGGIVHLELWVTQGNDRAERLYARHGFQRTGRVQPVREGDSRLEFAMKRRAPMDESKAAPQLPT